MSTTTTRAITGTTIGLGSLVLATPVAAHPGHGQSTSWGVLDGVLHPILGLDHLLTIVAVGAVAALVATMGSARPGPRRSPWTIPLAFVVGMAVGGIGGLLWGERAGVELLIAASLVALGVFVAAAFHGPLVWMPVLMVGVGALHGQAHGAELPVGAAPGGYVVGFLVSTMALLAVGTAAGLGLRRAPALRIAAGSVMSVAGAWMLLGA
jgi:urease accessory protein